MANSICYGVIAIFAIWQIAFAIFAIGFMVLPYTVLQISAAGVIIALLHNFFFALSALPRRRAFFYAPASLFLSAVKKALPGGSRYPVFQSLDRNDIRSP